MIDKMLRLLVLVSCVLSALCAPSLTDPALDNHWMTFKKSFNKEYSTVEEGMRRLIWEKNLAYIRNHNLEADMGQHKFFLGMNEHGDMTDNEYGLYLRGYKTFNRTTGATFMAPNNVEYPEMVDWRKQGYVTPVKNQKQCGSCWAFSTTGSLEGQHFKKTGKLVSLSEQNLVDCSKKYGNNGCHGGAMENAFKYIKANGGIDTEQSYPYTAKDGMCHFKQSDVGATDTGFVDIPRGDEDALLKAAATVGPISVAIDASKPTFRFYKHGVYFDKKCSSRRLDHGVLVVGYGSDMGKKYWIVKNSWGASWGNEGYIWMSRDHDNNCGIATQACYPLV